MQIDWNILGHEWAAELLGQHIARQEVRQAYLFSGPPGVGRRSLALRFAQAINCLQPPFPGQPCGKCFVCTHTLALQLPDLTLVEPLDDDGKPNPGGSLKIEQMRALQHTLSLSPYQASRRVALVPNFQDATDQAQNSLLKTLEEAPERAILLLTADSPENLLPTITSRCEILRLRPLGLERLAEALEGRWGMDKFLARRLAHLSGGRVGYALNLQANPRDLERIHAWLDDLLQLLGGGRYPRFKYAEQFKFAKNRDALRRMLQTWLSLWRDLLLACSGAGVPFTNLELENEIQNLAARLDLDTVRTSLAALEKALQRLDANVNTQLLIEVLLLDLPRIR